MQIGQLVDLAGRVVLLCLTRSPRGARTHARWYMWMSRYRDQCDSENVCRIQASVGGWGVCTTKWVRSKQASQSKPEKNDESETNNNSDDNGTVGDALPPAPSSSSRLRFRVSSISLPSSIRPRITPPLLRNVNARMLPSINKILRTGCPWGGQKRNVGY